MVTVEMPSPAAFEIRALTLDLYQPVIALLNATEGVALRNADYLLQFERYLDRNPGTSFVALQNGDIVGCVLSGHDGRRGYLYHLAVAQFHRRRGIARLLVNRCVVALSECGIDKIHLDVLGKNEQGKDFWEHLGWKRRSDIVRFSMVTIDDLDA